MAHHDDSLPPSPIETPRVLLVDNDAERVILLASRLTAEGYAVEIHARDARLLSFVCNDPPDLILLDVGTPSTEGIDRCAELRALDASRQVPIILLSRGARDEHAVVQGLLAGADDFVFTDGRLDELRARISVQIRNRRDRYLLAWARQQRATFRRAAMLDPLTQLMNRRAADERLDGLIRAGGPLLVMMVDIDHFKAVNDTFGHAEGDRVIREVAATLARGTRGEDIVARYGGEEFLLAVSHATPENAARIGERFRRAVSDHDLGGDVPRVTVSVGVAVIPAGHQRPTRDQCLALADDALYEAKRAGRDRVCVRWFDGDPAKSYVPVPRGENTVSESPALIA
jgi:two-component system, cell cycle response regulator